MRFSQNKLILLYKPVIPVLEHTKQNLCSWWKGIRSFSVHSPIKPKASPIESDITPGISSDCLQSIIDGLEGEVMIINPDYSIKQVNNAMLQRLDTTAAKIKGQPCFKVSHNADEPCSLPWCECPMTRVLETGDSVSVIHTHPGNREDEHDERWIEVVASPLRDGLGRITEVIELQRDVSENKKLRKEILRANRELLALNSITLALSQNLDLMATLRTAADTMLDALEAQISWVTLLNEDDAAPTIHANRELPTDVVNELMQVVKNLGLGEKTASATYSVVPDNSNGGSGQLWQFALTPLKLKGVVLGTAGVGTVKQPVDQQRVQLLDAIGHQIATAVERCRLYGEVQRARDLRGELLRKVITAQEEERRRIARELHDETGQALTALRLCLERLSQVSASGASTEVNSQLAQSLNLCQQADEEIDKLIFDLRPSLLDDLGLVEAIEYFINMRLTAAGIKADLTVTGEERRLSSEREVSIFRMIQEGINNIFKHARAKSVAINLKFNVDKLEVQIQDDGCGFEVKQVVSPQNTRSGLGLLGMRERMSLIGGSLAITSKVGVGTCVKATVPLNGDGVDA
ncbi:MAG: hypothetical protein A2Y89_00665 [Chloroflexi bacterium RBG_13_51_18]|nr:MAG: hypothetical protein A2Y89_00665 [Chloroflexi bacterium RBG_13_51_18]